MPTITLSSYDSAGLFRTREQWNTDVPLPIAGGGELRYESTEDTAYAPLRLTLFFTSTDDVRAFADAVTDAIPYEQDPDKAQRWYNVLGALNAMMEQAPTPEAPNTV